MPMKLKNSWLGVSNDTLTRFGAVSELCVREMLEGVLNASLSDFAIAIKWNCRTKWWKY